MGTKCNGASNNFVIHSMIDADRKVQVLAFMHAESDVEYDEHMISKILNRCAREASM